MQENFESKNKIINKIIVCIAVYLFIEILGIIDWRSLFPVPSPMRYEGYGVLASITATAAVFVKSILMIIVFRLFMYIRATKNTEKLYKAVFWILIAVNILTFLLSAAYIVILNYFPKYITQASLDIALISNISRIYAYLTIALQLPFYIAIVIREKRDINWMIMGSLTSAVIYFAGAAVYSIVRFLNPSSIYGAQSQASFAAALGLFNNIREYFWIAGACALVLIFKMRYGRYKAQNAQ